MDSAEQVLRQPLALAAQLLMAVVVALVAALLWRLMVGKDQW